MRVWTLFAGVNLILLVGGLGAWGMHLTTEARHDGWVIVVGVLTANAVVGTVYLVASWWKRLSEQE